MKSARFAAIIAVVLFVLSPMLSAKSVDKIPTKITILIASNQGTDFDMDNDAYRDQLIQLFSFSNYKQLKTLSLDLAKGERQIVALPEGYELVLSLQREERERAYIQALIRKGREQFVDTVLSIQKKGVVFLGGPQTPSGTLIVALENWL
jgi:hypothetical protein